MLCGSLPNQASRNGEHCPEVFLAPTAGRHFHIYYFEFVEIDEGVEGIICFMLFFNLLIVIW